MSAFPWSTLITTAAPVVASLGTVGIGGYYKRMRAADKAKRAAVAAERRAIQDAYVNVVVIGRALASALRHRDYSGLSETSRETREAKRDVKDLTKEFQQALGLAEIIAVGNLAAQEAISRMRATTSPGGGRPMTAPELESGIEAFLEAARNSYLVESKRRLPHRRK